MPAFLVQALFEGTIVGSTSIKLLSLKAPVCALGVCDYQNMWYHDFADYCLESITINRLIGDLDNSAANKTILLLQVLLVMLTPSADYQFNRSLQCASKIASASDLRGCGP